MNSSYQISKQRENQELRLQIKALALEKHILIVEKRYEETIKKEEERYQRLLRVLKLEYELTNQDLGKQLAEIQQQQRNMKQYLQQYLNLQLQQQQQSSPAQLPTPPHQLCRILLPQEPQLPKSPEPQISCDSPPSPPAVVRKGEKQCSRCDVVKTNSWRKGPSGQAYCHACGLEFDRLVKKKGIVFARREMAIKIRRGNDGKRIIN